MPIVVNSNTTATVASLARICWRMRDGLVLVTHDGMELLLSQDSRAMVAKYVHDAVVRWWWQRLEMRCPELRPPVGKASVGPCWAPLMKLLDPARKCPDWNGSLRGALRSAVCNRQWPQSRKFAAGLTTSDICLRCARAAVGGSHVPAGTLVHRCVHCPHLAGQCMPRPRSNKFAMLASLSPDALRGLLVLCSFLVLLMYPRHRASLRSDGW